MTRLGSFGVLEEGRGRPPEGHDSIGIEEVSGGLVGMGERGRRAWLRGGVGWRRSQRASFSLRFVTRGTLGCYMAALGTRGNPLLGTKEGKVVISGRVGGGLEGGDWGGRVVGGGW